MSCRLDEVLVAALQEHYNGDDERARIIFGVDQEGHLGAYVHLDFATKPVEVPDGAQEFGPELDRFVEQMRFAHMAGFQGWLQRMTKVCPLCGGDVESTSSVIETAATAPAILEIEGDLLLRERFHQQMPTPRPKFTCADCSWSPQIPQLTHPLGGPKDVQD